MDKNIVKAKKFFTDIRDVSQDMLDIIQQEEQGRQPSEDQVTMILGRFALLQMQDKL